MNGSVASGTDARWRSRAAWVVTAPAPAGVFDGIGDYAARLATALASTEQTQLVVGDRDPLPALADVAGVLHQYSPHSQSRTFDRWLQAAAVHGVPVVVTVHEYWPPASWSPRRAVLRWQNRRRLGALLRAASAVVVTQEIYARELLADGVCAGKNIHVIPVGSNITRFDASAERTGGLVLFGQPASFERAHLAALAAWLAEGVDRPRFTWIGRSGDELERAWHDLGATTSDAVRLVGGADEAGVSALLGQATIGLAPYANGASGKRTTLAALLQHGVPTVATTGIVTDSWLQTSDGVQTVADDDPRAFVDAVETLLRDSSERERLSRTAEALFSTRLAWPHLAGQYRAVMNDASHPDKDRDAR